MKKRRLLYLQLYNDIHKFTVLSLSTHEYLLTVYMHIYILKPCRYENNLSLKYFVKTKTVKINKHDQIKRILLKREA